jgi:hypothetical protein
MIILLVLVALVVSFYILEDKLCSDILNGIFFILLIPLILFLLFWPLAYISSKDSFITYQSTKTVIEKARKSNISEVERAALTNKIIEINSEIASAKYWNKTIFDCLIYDEFADLEPLK